jgi:hypothetical protein
MPRMLCLFVMVLKCGADVALREHIFLFLKIAVFSNYPSSLQIAIERCLLRHMKCHPQYNILHA